MNNKYDIQKSAEREALVLEYTRELRAQYSEEQFDDVALNMRAQRLADKQIVEKIIAEAMAKQEELEKEYERNQEAK